MPTGRIIEWQRERGFGYLESDRRRIFLHVRDFAERHKLPEVGDEIRFEIGTDKQGRPCAQRAVPLNDGGRLRPVHGLFFALLLLPAYAVHQRLGMVGLGYAAGWIAALSVITYLVYAWDKRQARSKHRREPERHLHLLELIGGWPGAFIAQRRLRHKSAKPSYLVVFVLIIGLYQFLAIDSLIGSPFVRMVVRSVMN